MQKIIGEFNELNKVRKKLNKIARSKVHSQEDKAAMDEKINNIKELLLRSNSRIEQSSIHKELDTIKTIL